jgi:thymidine kinase
MPTTLDIIIGPMFSGKSSELIRRVRRAKIRKLNVMVIKPNIDKRYEDTKISTHDGSTIECVNLDISGLKSLSIPRKTHLIAIDEAQFFYDLFSFVKKYMEKGKHLIIAGLNGDYRKHKFGEIVDLLPLATKVTKLSAVCSVCGKKAHYTYRKTKDEKQVLIGESDIYEARCYKCWEKGMNHLSENLIITDKNK